LLQQTAARAAPQSVSV